MLTLKQIIKKLSDRNVKEISRRTGISYLAIYNIIKGITKPHFSTQKVLSDYFEEHK